MLVKNTMSASAARRLGGSIKAVHNTKVDTDTRVLSTYEVLSTIQLPKQSFSPIKTQETLVGKKCNFMRILTSRHPTRLHHGSRWPPYPGPGTCQHGLWIPTLGEDYCHRNEIEGNFSINHGHRQQHQLHL